MIDEGILNKESRLIALYGADAQSSPFLQILNKTFKSAGLNDFAIGLNIKEEDFAYMVNGMPNSKVKMALFEPEYCEEATPYMNSMDSCTKRTGYCDGAYAQDGKLEGICFLAKTFERLIACEGITLYDKRILILGATPISKAILPLIESAGVSSIALYDASVENAAILLNDEFGSSGAIKNDVCWYKEGLDIDAKDSDIIINTMNPDKNVHIVNGERKIYLDFVSKEFMTMKALSVAKEWLGAKISCDLYNELMSHLKG